MANLSDIISDPRYISGVKENISKYWLPALALSLGTGGVSSYLSSRSKRQGETKAQRRNRLIKSFLYPALGVGGVGLLAAAAEPALNIDFSKSKADTGDNNDESGMGTAATVGGYIGAGGGAIGVAKDAYKRISNPNLQSNKAVVAQKLREIERDIVNTKNDIEKLKSEGLKDVKGHESKLENLNKQKSVLEKDLAALKGELGRRAKFKADAATAAKRMGRPLGKGAARIGGGGALGALAGLLLGGGAGKITDWFKEKMF